MERKDIESVGDVMRHFVEKARMEERLEERQAVELWPALVGVELSRKSPRPEVRNGVMYVRISHAPLRHELFLKRSLLCRLLNEMLDQPVIKEIRFIS